MNNPLDKKNPFFNTIPPRVIADFGGRRKIFERRLHQIPIDHQDRRCGHDRRSGFDRRSTAEKHLEKHPEKRVEEIGTDT